MDKTPIINKIKSAHPEWADLADKAMSGCETALTGLVANAMRAGGAYLSPDEWQVVANWPDERNIVIKAVRALHNIVIGGIGTLEQQSVALDLAEELLALLPRKRTETPQNGDVETK